MCLHKAEKVARFYLFVWRITMQLLKFQSLNIFWIQLSHKKFTPLWKQWVLKPQYVNFGDTQIFKFYCNNQEQNDLIRKGYKRKKQLSISWYILLHNSQNAINFLIVDQVPRIIPAWFYPIFFFFFFCCGTSSLYTVKMYYFHWLIKKLNLSVVE